ncbi:hypothetical protein DFH09DRAFT_1362052 [Mycena vulgaris]|nr:hypothetical protein DFH09DRAFT_1362052 [Mycena vulgaris]
MNFPGTRVFYFNSAGTAVYGTVQQVMPVAGGTPLLLIKLDSGLTVSIPLAPVLWFVLGDFPVDWLGRDTYQDPIILGHTGTAVRNYYPGANPSSPAPTSLTRDHRRRRHRSRRSLSFDDPTNLGSTSISTAITGPVTAPASTNANAGPGARAPPSHAEHVLASLELSRPLASGTRWSVTVGNDLLRNTNTTAAFAAHESQRARERHIDTESRFDWLTTRVDALADTIHEGPRNNDDSLLASLANGHNEAVAAIAPKFLKF